MKVHAYAATVSHAINRHSRHGTLLLTARPYALAHTCGWLLAAACASDLHSGFMNVSVSCCVLSGLDHPTPSRAL
jgi:hypothetical protein